MKVVVWVILMAGVGYGAYRFWVYANTPAADRSRETDMRQVLGGRAPRATPEEPQADLKYQGRYFSFMYPARATKLVQNTDLPAILERIDLEIKEPRLSIIVAAINSSEKSLDDVPGVNLRRQQKDVYEEAAVTVGYGRNPVFSRIDGTEKTLFIIREGRLYTLSVTGNNSTELKNLWDKILPTFHFL
jgi:hypothetical protein